MHHNIGVRTKKIQELSILTRSFDLIALQEVHGSAFVLEMEREGLLRSHVFLSYHPVGRGGNIRHDIGGTAFLAKREFCVQIDDCQFAPLGSLQLEDRLPVLEVLIPGRAICAQFWDSRVAKTIRVLNVHNHGLSAGNMKNIEDAFKRDRDWVALEIAALFC